jgi:signal peptidase II
MSRFIFFTTAGVIVLIDQFTKLLVVRSIALESSRELIPNFLYFTRTTNTGAAFGLLPHATSGLSLVALVCIVGIVIFTFRSKWPLPLLLGLGFALPLGGAFGNFLDRIRLGHVIDFVQVQLGTYTWPIFNVADSSICIGVALLIIVALKKPLPASTMREEISPLP